MKLPTILSHRAQGFGYKENSIKAIKHTLRTKIKFIEIDVRLTKDNIYVLTHYPYYYDEHHNLIYIKDKTYNQQKDNLEKFENILPSLKKSNKTLLIDIKDYGAEQSLIKLIKKHKLQKQIIVVSWNLTILKKIHKLNKSLPLSFSFYPTTNILQKIKCNLINDFSLTNNCYTLNKPITDYDLKKGTTIGHFLSGIPNLKLLSINIPWYLATKRIVNQAKQRNIKINIFTINNKLTYNLSKNKADAIFTNKPRLFLK
jgi:glycerophosphoryl diester phosphodiesterase